MSHPTPISEIDPVEAERRRGEDPAHPVLLDVREMHEFIDVRAPGALLVPTSTFAARIDEVPPDRPIMVICKTGIRSAAVAGFLQRAGRSDVVNVRGGMDAWEGAGLPIAIGPLEPGEGELPG